MVRVGATHSVLAMVCSVLTVSAGAQQISVQASVDRASVRENESFTYVVRAEGRVRGEPDASALEQQFDILGRNSNTRIQIVNGQTQQVAEWVYQLMPMAVGRFTLPAVQVAGIASNAVELEVLPAAVSDDEPADIFIEVEADTTMPYVQSQVIYTLRLFVGVGTGRATLTAPQLTGGEAIIERLGEDRQYQTVRGGRDFIVRERLYAIFPQETGTLTIGPATFEAMVIPNRGFSRVQRLRSGTLDLTVQAAVAPPPQYPNAVWLPARSLTLTEHWADQAQHFSLGVPRTRTLTIEAEGLLETQLPPIEAGNTAGVRQYPDQPELENEISELGIIGRRIERYAVIAQSHGDIEIPAAEIAWWNIDTERWELARVEARRLTVLPGDEPEAPTEPVSPAATEQASLPSGGGYWPVLSLGLALGWIITALLWLRSSLAVRGRAEGAETAATPRRARNRQLQRKLRAACERNDAALAHRLLIQWAALRFPDSPPQSLGILAELLPDRLAAEVYRLESYLYGSDGEPWSGKPLAVAMAGVEAVKRNRSEGETDPLLPLYR